MVDKNIQLSKTLSYVLRHGAIKLGLNFQTGGFVDVEEILKLPQLKNYTENDIYNVVNNNDKKRFCLENQSGKLRIRANQGHSMEVDGLELKEITDPILYPTVIHGTTYQAWQRIQKTGLCKMKRNHIHCAKGVPEDATVISGMRKSCEVLIYVDLQKALTDGIKFFESSNGVILTPGDSTGILNCNYFLKVIDKKKETELNFSSQ